MDNLHNENDASKNLIGLQITELKPELIMLELNVEVNARIFVTVSKTFKPVFL